MSNIIDSIQLSGTVYTLSAQTGGGGVPESAFTAYTAATDERISQDEEVTAAALNELNEAISSGSVTVDMAFDSGSTNPVANSVITPAVTKHYEGQLPAEYTGGYSGGTYVGGFSATTYDDAASYVIRNTTYTTRMYKDGIRLKFIDAEDVETEVFACSASTYYNTVYNSPSSYANITIDTVGKNIEITPINNYKLSYVCFYEYYDNSLMTNITNAFSATSYQSFDKTAIQLIDDLSIPKIEAGRGISITTGETADTVSFNLPISAGTGTNSIIEGDSYNTADGNYSHAEGYYNTANGPYSHAEGNRTSASGQSSHAEGYRTSAMTDYSHAEGYWTKTSGYSSHAEGQYTITTNQSEHASGQYNVSSSGSSTWGDSGNTLFSVGNGDWSARHNAFEIRQNGDIYLSSGGTDIKLQDHLGGGSITVDTALDSGSTNPVQNKVIYNKIDEVEQVTAAALNELNDAISGKVDTSTYNTYTAATDTALNGKQATLVSGTNIKTINNESILGSGNIDIQGGGTVDQTIISGSTNAVAGGAVYNKIDEVEQVTAAGLNALNDNFGGLKLVKLSQAAYDSLATKDASTLYVIVD